MAQAALAITNPAPAIHEYALSAQSLKAQVAVIRDVMNSIMRVDHHYGVIPGCGKKPTLLKPGAEALAMAFRLAAEFKVSQTDMGNGHREYDVTCIITHMPTGGYVGQGIGSCSTMEKKYRYRTGGGEVTDIAVPKAYWDARNDDPRKAADILREAANKAGHEGEKFGTKKDEAGTWRISTFSESAENENIADCYNTCLKMAKKRAYVDAILTCTAASDSFTQDVEDFQDDQPQQRRNSRPAQTAAAPQFDSLDMETIRASIFACKTVGQLEATFKNLNIPPKHPEYKTVTDLCAEIKGMILSDIANPDNF
ncbi:MAG: hypothetical protein LBV80_08125 [Deltaproteobacteria bacterium]|jgi:hypothetical protein|nr:hypothetical protein [Deltaproteobacteria bacterium]